MTAPQMIIDRDAVVARVMATGRGDTVRELLTERHALIARGDVVRASECARAVNDLAGHWQYGQFVGAEEIADALHIGETAWERQCRIAHEGLAKRDPRP